MTGYRYKIDCGYDIINSNGRSATFLNGKHQKD